MDALFLYCILIISTIVSVSMNQVCLFGINGTRGLVRQSSPASVKIEHDSSIDS